MIITKKLETIKKSRGKNTCEMIVLHHTAGGSFDSNMNLLALNQTRQASCHFVVGENGEIGQIGNETDILWHAGESSWNGKTNLNLYSIGIEIVDKNGTFTDVQRKSVDDLVCYLIEKYSIKYENLVRHKDIAPGRKIDPYDTLWNTRFSTFEKYKNYLFNKNEIMKEFANLQGYEIFGDNEEDYNKPATIGDLKDLIEVALLRFDEKKTNGTLQKR